MLRVTTVGTGTAAPSAARVQSAVLVAWDTGQLLVDCGSGVVGRMAQLGEDWAAITHVALTHFHADHTSDLATLLYAWRYGLLPPRQAPVTLIGPAGTRALLDRLAAAFGAGLASAVPLTVREVAPGETLALDGGASLEARAVPHVPESLAYALRVAGARLVLSGDLGYDEGFAAWAAGSDLLVLECSLPDALAIPSHLTPRQCGAIGAIARPGLLALTHFYPPVEGEDIVGQVRERYDGPLQLAADGWTWRSAPLPVASP